MEATTYPSYTVIGTSDEVTTCVSDFRDSVGGFGPMAAAWQADGVQVRAAAAGAAARAAFAAELDAIITHPTDSSIRS